MNQTHPFHSFMLQAAALAQNARWCTCPNPSVGALLVKDGAVVAKGFHKGPGLPHAEIEALEDARKKGVSPAECTMVVTLEPCRHVGKTPPCTEALLAAGIRHVVIGALDPNPTAGGGADVLRSHGVTVETGVALDECRDLIDDFITWQTSPYPYTILKLASTLDGHIATRSGQSRWISSAESRAQVHELRSHMNAVIVGGNTFYKDDPLLTCRMPQDSADAAPIQQPLAVVVTSRLPEPGDPMRLLRERPHETVFWTTAASAASPKAEALRRMGVRIFGLNSQSKPFSGAYTMRAELNIAEGLALLREEFGCMYALCEGGGNLGLSMLEGGLIHEMQVYVAPKILGDEKAAPLFTGRSPMQMDEALNLRITASKRTGEDIAITLKPSANSPQTSTTEAS